MGRRITILGMGPSANERRWDIQRYCEGTEIWSLNNAYLHFPQLREGHQFARYFELHSWRYLSTWVPGRVPDGRPVDHWAELDRLGCPVYIMQHLPLVRRQKLYAARAVMRQIRARVYFLGSPSLMLALALYEHRRGQTVDYLQSYGIDTSDPDHGQQRASWAWWTSQAAALGIEMGGTMLDYQDEFEKDEGLRNLRELIQGEIDKEDAAKASESVPECLKTDGTLPEDRSEGEEGEDMRALRELIQAQVDREPDTPAPALPAGAHQ